MPTLSATGSRWVSVAVLALFLMIAVGLCDRDLEFILEPDFDVGPIETWQEYFATRGIAVVAGQGPHVYLDGQRVLYAVATGFGERTSSLSAWLAVHSPNRASYAFGAAFLLDAVSYALGCWFVYKAAFELGRS